MVLLMDDGYIDGCLLNARWVIDGGMMDGFLMDGCVAGGWRNEQWTDADL